MAEPRDGPGLGQKAAGETFVRGELGMNDLDRHIPVERGIPGTVHHAHPAAPDLGSQLVLGSERKLQTAGQIGSEFSHTRDSGGSPRRGSP